MGSPRKILKAVSLMALAGLMMGNEGCGEDKVEEVTAKRPRRIVEVGKIAAQPIQLPNNQIFDLEFVINQQFPDVLVSSDEYAVLNRDLFSYDPGTRMGIKDHEIISKMGVVAQKWHYSKEAECLINLPQFRLNGVVNSYEWVSGGGLSVGYTPSGNHNVSNIGGTVNFDKAQMDLTLRAIHPINNRITEAANITKDQIKTKVGFSISFGLISIGPEFYHQKGLAQVSKEAIEKALSSLRARTDNREWYTRVGARHDNFVTIIGGHDVKLKEGDVVSIHNSLYYWDGEVCDPEAFRGDLHGDAVAIGVVDEVGELLSRVKIDPQSIGAEDPLTGSVVKIMRLVDEPASK